MLVSEHFALSDVNRNCWCFLNSSDILIMKAIILSDDTIKLKSDVKTHFGTRKNHNGIDLLSPKHGILPRSCVVSI